MPYYIQCQCFSIPVGCCIVKNAVHSQHNKTSTLFTAVVLVRCFERRCDIVGVAVGWSQQKISMHRGGIYALFTKYICPTDQNIFSLNCVVALHVMIMLIAFTSHVSVASIFAECKKATSLHLCCTAPNSYLIQLEHRHLLHHHSVIAVNLIKE